MGIRFDAQDAGTPGIDGKNRSPKGIADQVPEESMPAAIRSVRRPDDRYTPGCEDGVKGIVLPVANDGAGGYPRGRISE